MLDSSFYSHIRKVKFCAQVETISVLFTVAFFIFALGTWTYNRLVSAFCAVITIASLVSMLYCSRFERNTDAPNALYAIPLNAMRLEDIVRILSGKKLDDDSYVSFLMSGGVTVRLYIQSMPHFIPADLVKKKKRANLLINRIYQVKTEAPLFEIASSLRITLLVCEDKNDELVRWIARDTGRLLSRAESIVNAAVVLSDGTLLFPACPFGVSPNEVKRYLVGIELLVQQLGFDNSCQ